MKRDIDVSYIVDSFFSLTSTMSLLVQYNTFLQFNTRPYIDRLSKVYLTCEMILGLNRLPVLGNMSFICILLAVAYSSLVQVFVILYILILENVKASYLFSISTNVSHFGLTIVYSFISWKRMYLYYCELNKFDMKVGCRPYSPKGSIKNFVLLVAIAGLVALLYLSTHLVPQMRKYLPLTLLIHTLDVLEIHYFGHLLNLLIPRMRLINHFMELSLTNTKETSSLRFKEFKLLKRGLTKSNCEMKKVMDLYHTLIKAYDLLMEAIKWQVTCMRTICLYHCIILTC